MVELVGGGSVINGAFFFKLQDHKRLPCLDDMDWCNQLGESIFIRKFNHVKFTYLK